jgi:hypothetical protein
MFNRKKKDATSAKRHQQTGRFDDKYSHSATGLIRNYRRNQTISSYRDDDDDETSQRKKTHELNRLRHKLFVICMVFTGISAVILALLSQYTGSVNITTTPAEIDLSSLSSYIDTVNEYYNDNSLERFSFFFKQDNFIAYIQSKHPEVGEIKTMTSWNVVTSETIFNMKMREPVAKWTISNQDYYVDGNGKAFTINYFDEPTLLIFDENHLEIKPGETAIASNRFLEFVGRLVSDLYSEGLNIKRATIPIGMMRELDVLINGYDYTFKLAIDRSPAEQAEDIKRLIKHFSSQSTKPKYIDIRVKSKAFYK